MNTIKISDNQEFKVQVLIKIGLNSDGETIREEFTGKGQASLNERLTHAYRVAELYKRSRVVVNIRK